MTILSHPRTMLADRSGVAMLEFALSLPIVLGLGLYGIETANLALINLKVSQITLALADNASRVGITNSLSQQQLREVDINDALQAARLQGAGINLTTNGRIILSSLENVKQTYDSAAVQRIHWQRCIGQKSGAGYDSSYGTTTTTAGTDNTQATKGTDASTGMGDTGAKVIAPPNSAVMFVEVNYQYKPLVSYGIFGPARVHYIASFIVRDRRVFTQIFNPDPAATPSTCNLYAA